MIPDVIIAHGTATVSNDEVEDSVFSTAFPNGVPVTCTKWSIGHTLGASAAMDIIAGCMMLKHRAVFGIATTSRLDPSFKSTYLIHGSDRKFSPQNILISSLGFGGVHGAVFLKGPTIE